MGILTQICDWEDRFRDCLYARANSQQLLAQDLELLEELRLDSDSRFENGSLSPERLRDSTSTWAILFDRLIPLLCERNRGKEPEVILRQVGFSEAVELGGELLSSLWVPPDLRFHAYVPLPSEVQRTILKNYIINPVDLPQACHMSGLAADTELIEQLEECIPPRWQDLKVALATHTTSGSDTEDNPEHILWIGGEGLKLAEKGRAICELALEACALTFEGLQDFRFTWRTVFGRLRSLPPGCRPDIHGLILVARAATDQIVDLLEKIRTGDQFLLPPGCDVMQRS